MEIKVDVGAETYDALEKIAKEKQQSLEVTYAEMMSLGARVYLSSREKKIDRTTKALLINTRENNKILAEILHIIFDRNKSELGVYDAETALDMIGRMTVDYVEEVVEAG